MESKKTTLEKAEAWLFGAIGRRTAAITQYPYLWGHIWRAGKKLKKVLTNRRAWAIIINVKYLESNLLLFKIMAGISLTVRRVRSLSSVTNPGHFFVKGHISCDKQLH